MEIYVLHYDGEMFEKRSNKSRKVRAYGTEGMAMGIAKCFSKQSHLDLDKFEVVKYVPVTTKENENHE